MRFALNNCGRRPAAGAMGNVSRPPPLDQTIRRFNLFYAKACI
jgi:hypothetical protein